MKAVNQRRKFLKTSTTLGALSMAGLALLTLSSDEEKDEDQKISPAEDLMQEHGLLNRILLIYDSCRIRLTNKQDINPDILQSSAGIIRSFVEDYHEKQEENYLFPRFEKANQLTDLVKVLYQQHQSGRAITNQIIGLSKMKTLTDTENKKLIELLTIFINMYRPHEAREDTVLFPAFRKIVSANEYDSLGEEFEKNEHKLFGKDGFESMVERVADIEKQLGIFDLLQFTA